MTRRWSERSRRALTDLRNGGDVKKGGGGGGVEELQLPYLAFCGVFHNVFLYSGVRMVNHG